jgi:radical SAM superfamily enzyme YgiQ (UPF0313 family)
MRISLIYVQSIEGNNVVPPLGLMYIAAVASKAAHNVQFMDADPDEINVVEKVRAFNPDLIGLSFLTTEFKKACILSHKLKTAIPGAILCCGGVHTTVDTETVLRKFNVDFCVVGEGEVTFLEVCKRIQAGHSYADVKGTCLLKDGQFIKASQRELIQDLDAIPFPARNLIDFSNIYLTFPGVIKGKYVRSTTLMAGRGCYFNCSFCSVEKMFGRGCRLRSPNNILQEVIYLQKTYGVKGIYFVDSTLTANRKWMISFCGEIIRQNVKFIWAGNTRADNVDIEMLKLMRKSGCVQLDYGVEHGSLKILKMFNKLISPQKTISAINMTRDAGIRIGATFMVGNPDEKLEDLQMTFNLAKKLKANYTVFFFSIPFPGTRLWEIAKARNLIPDDVNYDSQWNIRTGSPLMAENISAKELEILRAKFQNHFFIRNYFNLSNVIIQIYLLRIMLKYPLIAWKEIKKALRYKRWDLFVEGALVAYRRNLYKYY